MKINNKGYASTIIMFSILTLFLISMLMLVKTMNNSSSLNKQISGKIIDNIDYDASGSVQVRLKKLENQLNNMEISLLDKMYPIGSIYMSTEDDTIEKVQEKFGGMWERYAEGTTIVSVGTYTDSKGNVNSYAKNTQGGSNNVTLTTNNLPSHMHSVIAKGTISSTFTGTAVPSTSTGSGYSIGYGSSTRTSGAGNAAFYRTVSQSGTTTAGNHLVGYSPSAYVDRTDQNYPGQAHTHNYVDYYANSISGVAPHTHNVTAKGTVSSTFTGSSVATSSVGLNMAFNVQNPYTSVYMYKRVS